MINVKLYNTLWSTEGLDIVYNAFAIIFIVDLDEEWKQYAICGCGRLLWFQKLDLNTETFDEKRQTHNKKIVVTCFKTHSVESSAS